MKKFFVILAVAASLAAIPVSNVLVKAHVPAHKEQVCHKGLVRTVGESAVGGHLGHGDCQIAKATLVPPLFTGDACVIQNAGTACDF